MSKGSRERQTKEHGYFRILMTGLMSSSFDMIRKLETSFNSLTTYKARPTAFMRSWTKEVIYFIILFFPGRGKVYRC